MKTSRGCELFFAKGCHLNPSLYERCICINPSLIKLLSNAFAGSQILALWLTFGKQEFYLTVSLDRKKNKDS